MGAQAGEALTPPTPQLPSLALGRGARIGLIAVLALLSLGALLVLRGIRFDFNPQKVYESSSSAFELLREHDGLFGRDDNVVVVLVDGMGADDPAVIEYLRRVRDNLAHLPGVTRVDGLPSAQLMQEQDGALTPLPIIPPGPVGEVAVARVRAAAHDPLLGGVLVAQDLSVTALFALLAPGIYDLNELTPVIEGIERTLRELERPSGLRARVAGIPFVRVDAVRDLIGDQLRFLPLLALTYLVILVLIFRWIWGVVLPLLVVGMSILWSMAAIVAIGESINIVNNVLPTLLFVIGISDSIHLLSRYREELALGRSHDEAVGIMFRRLVLACFLTSATTAIGVASLVVAETPLLRNFGLMAAMGVMLAYVVTLAVIPVVLSFVKPPRVQRKTPGAGDRVDRMLAWAAIGIVKRPIRVLLGAMLFTALCAWLATSLKVDSYLMAVYHESHPTQQTNRLVERAFGGVLPLDIVLRDKTARRDLRRDSDLLRRIAAMQRFLEQQPGVGRTVSEVDLLAAIYRAMSGAQASASAPRALPLDDATVAQLLLVADISGDAVTSQFDRFAVEEGRRVRVQSRVADMGARQVNALVARTRAEAQKIFYGRDDIEILFTGDGVVGSDSIERFVSDLAWSVFTAGLVIFFVIGLLFRSARIGVLSVLPSATPLVATLAMMAVADIYLDVTSIIVFSMALGLAVDNAIHILARYREERIAGAGCKAAVIRAYRGSGRAVALAAFLLLVGFFVLLTSSFAPTRRIGLLSGVCILGALIGVLVILPALLTLFDKARDDEQPQRRRE